MSCNPCLLDTGAILREVSRKLYPDLVDYHLPAEVLMEVGTQLSAWAKRIQYPGRIENAMFQAHGPGRGMVGRVISQEFALVVDGVHWTVRGAKARDEIEKGAIGLIQNRGSIVPVSIKCRWTRGARVLKFLYDPVEPWQQQWVANAIAAQGCRVEAAVLASQAPLRAMQQRPRL